MFVVEQSKGASDHQQEAISGRPLSAAKGSGAQGRSEGSHQGSVHKALDEASAELTSPFAGVISGSSSEWVIRGVKLLLALAVYGFGFGYLARVLRVRVVEPPRYGPALARTRELPPPSSLYTSTGVPVRTHA